MSFWVGLDSSELLGARNESGLYRFTELQAVLSDYLEELRIWFGARGIAVEDEHELMRDARRVLLNIAVGRAEGFEE